MGKNGSPVYIRSFCYIIEIILSAVFCLVWIITGAGEAVPKSLWSLFDMKALTILLTTLLVVCVVVIVVLVFRQRIRTKTKTSNVPTYFNLWPRKYVEGLY